LRKFTTPDFYNEAIQRKELMKMAHGIFLGIISQFLFGLLYLFSLWLQPLSGTDVFAWRMVMMVFGLFL